MPLRSTVEAFIATVEGGDTLRAMQEFYAPDASMQENQTAPRAGLEALLAHERKALAGVRSLKSQCLRPIVVDGDRVVIHWMFEFERLDGTVTRFEELAHQTWRDEKMVREQFFYDPAQFKATT